MALASKFNYDLAIVSFHPKMTDVDLTRILRSINSDNDSKDNNKKSFIIFEDIDCIFKSRKINDESKNNITLSILFIKQYILLFYK